MISLAFRVVCVSFAAGMTLAACSDPPTRPLQPTEISKDSACSLDGMLLADFPGPKAQIHYQSGSPDFFCDTVEMFSIYLRPEQQRRVSGLFVQDMGGADWNEPRGHWIDAKAAFYVKGSSRRGSMGPTLPSFAQQADAQAHAREYGGQVLRFDQITPEMVALDGGALHGDHM